MKIQPVILSGGSGTRLWPLSRELYPKQLLPLLGQETMLQETILRLDGLDKLLVNNNVANPIIVCNEEHRFLVAEQLRQVNIHPGAIILEPEGRNTAPALTIAAKYIADSYEDTIMLVLPADHVIQDRETFYSAILEGKHLAELDHLVTFGIVPDRAETGYGYIKKGKSISDQAYELMSFVEKPDVATAQDYLESGHYLWNSGMFMMKASVWLNAIHDFNIEIYNSCLDAVSNGITDYDFYRPNNKSFLSSPSDSIDYAVMEKIALDKKHHFISAVISLQAGWSDVGAWSALWDITDKDNNNNVIQGDVICQDTSNSMIWSDSRLIATVGLNDTIVVETSDAVMVAHKDCAQDIKNIVERLKNRNRGECLLHRRVYRPWGSYEGVDKGEQFQVKRITVNPGASLSLQMHNHRAEHWIVVKGIAKVTCGDNEFYLKENQSTYIPVETKHRLENTSDEPLEIIEVQSGKYLGEDDIVRFDDIYGR